jgi:hypothetical protein
VDFLRGIGQGLAKPLVAQLWTPDLAAIRQHRFNQNIKQAQLECWLYNVLLLAFGDKSMHGTRFR